MLAHVMRVNSSLINPSNLPKVEGQKLKGTAHVKNIYSRWMYPVALLFGGIIIWILLGDQTKFSLGFTPMLPFAAASLIFALFFGWQALGEYQIFSSTPISNIESASNGLNEISAKFTSENGTVLKTPIGNINCIYYKLELHYVTGGKYSRDYIEWSHEEGLPSKLYDGTGYLDADYTTAEMGHYVNIYQIYDNKWFDLAFRQNIFSSLNASISSGTLDFTKFTNSIGLTKRYGIDKLEYDSINRVAVPGGFSLVQYYIPCDSPYFVMANISDNGQRYNGKPLKNASVDSKSGMFSLLPTSKATAMNNLKMQVLVDFGIAILAFLVLILIVQSVLVHQSLALSHAVNSTTIYGRYVSSTAYTTSIYGGSSLYSTTIAGGGGLYPSCLPSNSSIICRNVTYNDTTGILKVVIGQNSGTEWTYANATLPFFYDELGYNVSGYVIPNGLKSGQPSVVSFDIGTDSKRVAAAERQLSNNSNSCGVAMSICVQNRANEFIIYLYYKNAATPSNYAGAQPYDLGVIYLQAPQ